MTKMRMNSLDLGDHEPSEASAHRNGDCSCGRLHISGRSYGGYPWCLVCCKLLPGQNRMVMETDHFRRLVRKRRVMVGAERTAVGYLRAYMTVLEQAQLRETMQILGRVEWLKRNHHQFGLHIRNLLRKVGFTDKSFDGGGSLDDVYYGLLCKTVELEYGNG